MPTDRFELHARVVDPRMPTGWHQCAGPYAKEEADRELATRTHATQKHGTGMEYKLVPFVRHAK